MNKHIKNNGHVDLIDPCRAILKRLGVPSVMENVPNSSLINPIILKGSMFGLGVQRTRWFETSHFMMQPLAGQRRGNVKVNRDDDGKYFQVTGHSVGTIEEWSEAMGINWMTKKELTQAIPPAYTKYIGLHFLTWQ